MGARSGPPRSQGRPPRSQRSVPAARRAAPPGCSSSSVSGKSVRSARFTARSGVTRESTTTPAATVPLSSNRQSLNRSLPRQRCIRISNPPMKVRLDYGVDGLEVNLPDGRTTVIEPAYPPGVANPEAELRRALAQPVGARPLAELVRAGNRIAISVCDGTRAQPRASMLRALFEAMPAASPRDIVILVATGTHRANTPHELERMLGREIVSRYRVVNHDARDGERLSHAGETTRGVPIWLNREWLEADFRILTGFVEPHFFAGFSGGPKMVAAGPRRTARPSWRIHGGAMIGAPQRHLGRHRRQSHLGRHSRDRAEDGPSSRSNVTLNSGPPDHGRLCGGAARRSPALPANLFASRRRCVPVAAPFDIVVTTNSGLSSRPEPVPVRQRGCRPPAGS